MILYAGLPITTTITNCIANSLVFQGEIKCIIANGQMMICVSAD